MLFQWKQHLLSTDNKVCWFTIDENDNQESQFFLYLAACLRIGNSSIGDGAQAIYKPGEKDAAKLFTATLLNELSHSKDNIYVFLDDFHRITEPSILDTINQLVTYAPENFHILIASRTVPDLPLVNLSIQDKVFTVEAGLLRFQIDEAKSFFDIRTDRHSAGDGAQQLCEFIDGWVAGLQLASISMNKGIDIGQYINSHKALTDELAEFFAQNILLNLSQETGRFLETTSILSRFNADLCNAILERDDSESILHELEQDNIFILPLAGELKWYKYHQLFSDFLNSRLEKHSPQIIPTLYERASNCCAENGRFAEAVQVML